MDDDLDLAIALSLQQTFDNETKKERHGRHEKVQGEWDERNWDPKSIVDKKLELSDPNPNIHDLFVQYDAMFFWRKLVSSGVAVWWSTRMTRCAGVCAYEGRGRLCSIRLSQPLLKLRPRKDLVQTLLHEMIHAYLFVTENYRDHDGHGPKFQSHMHRINEMSGANITIYHNFHDEVREYQQHWWKCNGPCQTRPPYYGLVKRAMNRAPSPRDPWWSQHQATCGGTYKKIKEPEGYGKKKLKSGQSKEEKKKKNDSRDIRDMFKKVDKSGEVAKANPSSASVREITPFEGEGKKLVDSKVDTLKAKGDSELSLHEKMLMAAEKRWRKAKQGGEVAKTSASSASVREITPFEGEGKKLVDSKVDTLKAKGDSELSRHEKMLMAAEKRWRKAKQSGRLGNSGAVLGQKQPREKYPPPNSLVNTTNASVNITRKKCSDNYSKPSPKKRRLTTDDTVIVLDSPQVATKSLTSSNSSRSNSISLIDLSKEAGPSTALHVRKPSSVQTEVIAVDDSDEDEVEQVESAPSSPSTSLSPELDDLRMCPVCGMSNIPKAIINAHVVFCLDAEEESQIVDDDNL